MATAGPLLWSMYPSTTVFALLLLLTDPFRTWVDFVRLVPRPAGKSIWESVERLAGFCLVNLYQLMNVCVLSSSSATAMVCAHKL